MRNLKQWRISLETKAWRAFYAIVSDDPGQAFFRGATAGALLPTLVVLCLM